MKAFLRFLNSREGNAIAAFLFCLGIQDFLNVPGPLAALITLLFFLGWRFSWP